MDTVNHLLRTQLFRLLQLHGQNVYQIRSRDIAKRLTTLTNDELQIFNRVEDEGQNGVWTKAIKQRTQIAQTVLNKCIKSLETKHLIKNFTNVKFPQRKYYILYYLEPLEEVSGGLFHDPDNGDLDTTLIEVLSNRILSFVQIRSWDKHTIMLQTPTMDRPGDKDDLARKQQEIFASGNGAPGKKFKPPSSSQRKTIFTPKPPTYEDYPTIADIAESIKQSGILKDSVDLSPSDMQLLIESLVMDNKLERMTAETFRVVRTALIYHDKRIYGDDWEGNGFTEAPCSRCPVFNLCEEGGPVSASNCEYYARWLRPWKYEDMEDLGKVYARKKPKMEET